MNSKLFKRKILLLFKRVPDEAYLKAIYFIKMHMKLNLKNPVLYNEKLQYLKLYDHNPIYQNMVDKYEMKKIVGGIIGEEHVVKTIGIWDNFESIDFSLLPKSFVLKATHDQGSVIVCTDKNQFDYKEARKKLNRALKTNFYYVGREWPYKNIKPRIIAEECIDDSGEGLIDYKFFCFGGRAKIMYISNDLSNEPRTDFFDMNFKHLNMRMRDQNSIHIPPKPKYFEEMKDAAELLSAGIPHLRVDFYCTESNYYVGELTFFHNGGFSKISPSIWMKTMGDWIQLPDRGMYEKNNNLDVNV